LEYPSAVHLSVIQKHLDSFDAPLASALFYLSMMVSSSTFICLIDCSSAINLVHSFVVSRLDLKALPCVDPHATLADGQTTLECNAYCVVLHGIAGRSMTDTFFIASISV